MRHATLLFQGKIFVFFFFGNLLVSFIFSERAADKPHIREIVRKANKVVEENDDHDRKYTNVRGRDLEMEGTSGSRESARKIFEMGARSAQRNARLYRLSQLRISSLISRLFSNGFL
jgi:hypothetical protein